MHAYKCVCVCGGAGHMLVCIKVDTKLLWWSARLFIIALALKKKKKTTSVMIFPILGVTLIADLTS